MSPLWNTAVLARNSKVNTGVYYDTNQGSG